MKTRFCAWVALASCAFLAVGGLAQEAKEPATVAGTVISTGNLSFAILSDNGAPWSFLVGTQASMPSGRLRVGERVRVFFTRLDQSRFLVSAVQVLDGAPKPRPPSEAAPAQLPRR